MVTALIPNFLKSSKPVAKILIASALMLMLYQGRYGGRILIMGNEIFENRFLSFPVATIFMPQCFYSSDF